MTKRTYRVYVIVELEDGEYVEFETYSWEGQDAMDIAYAIDMKLPQWKMATYYQDYSERHVIVSKRSFERELDRTREAWERSEALEFFRETGYIQEETG